MDHLHQVVGDNEVVAFAVALAAGVISGAFTRWALALRRLASR